MVRWTNRPMISSAPRTTTASDRLEKLRGVEIALNVEVVASDRGRSKNPELPARLSDRDQHVDRKNQINRTVKEEHGAEEVLNCGRVTEIESCAAGGVCAADELHRHRPL